MNDKIIRQAKQEVCKIRHAKQNNELAYITFDKLDSTGIVEHLFSTRKGGVSKDCLTSMNFSYSQGDIKENVDENFSRISRVLNSTVNDIVCSSQTHTTNVRKVTFKDKGKGVIYDKDYDNVDGLITNEPGIVLATFYADCVPLYIVDTRNKAIGLSHSGWRGTVGKMGKVTLDKMNSEYGTQPEDVCVVIAPSICQNCYEVSEDVAMEFQNTFEKDADKARAFWGRYKENILQSDIDNCLLYKKENDKYQLNLWYANYRVFVDAGVKDENIEITDVCTCCNSDLLFSHRATKGKRGNLGAFMSLKK